MLKYFRGLGATTKIYYHENLCTLRNYVEKMEDYKGISVFAAFTCIATYGRRLLGKCLTVKENQETLRTGTLWR